jgi:hypothetical protein
MPSREVATVASEFKGTVFVLDDKAFGMFAYYDNDLPPTGLSEQLEEDTDREFYGGRRSRDGNGSYSTLSLVSQDENSGSNVTLERVDRRPDILLNFEEKALLQFLRALSLPGMLALPGPDPDEYQADQEDHVWELRFKEREADRQGAIEEGPFLQAEGITQATEYRRTKRTVEDVLVGIRSDDCSLPKRERKSVSDYFSYAVAGRHLIRKLPPRPSPDSAKYTVDGVAFESPPEGDEIVPGVYLDVSPFKRGISKKRVNKFPNEITKTPRLSIGPASVKKQIEDSWEIIEPDPNAVPARLRDSRVANHYHNEDRKRKGIPLNRRVRSLT